MAKSICPVDTGFLQSSISGQAGKRISEIEAEAEYAQYVEYGTWKMDAQPYFTPAVERSAEMAFQIASNIYALKLEEEYNMMYQIALTGMMDQQINQSVNEIEDAYTAGLGVGYGGYTKSYGGISFRPDGSVGAGIHGYYWTKPEMWGEDTPMGRVAAKRLARLDEYRQKAFQDTSVITAETLRGNFPGSTKSSGAVNFGYSVGMFAMSSVMTSGGSYIEGLAIGLILGALATLIGLFFADIFSPITDEPQYYKPEVEIY